MPTKYDTEKRNICFAFSFLIETLYNMTKKPSLWLCLLFDAVGSLSYLLPAVGEWTDVIWAPISAFLFYRLFGGKTGKVGAVVSFVEELFPFIDIIPTFTIGYICTRLRKEPQAKFTEK